MFNIQTQSSSAKFIVKTKKRRGGGRADISKSTIQLLRTQVGCFAPDKTVLRSSRTGNGGGGGLKTMCLTQENRIMKVSCRLTSGRGQTQIVQDMKTEAKKQIGSRRGVYKCCSVRACGLRMKNPICMIRARYSACRRYLTDVLSIGGFNTSASKPERTEPQLL